RRADTRERQRRYLATASASASAATTVGLVITERPITSLHEAIHQAPPAGGQLTAVVEAERTVRIGSSRCGRGTEMRKHRDRCAILVYRNPGGHQHGRRVGSAGGIDHRRHVLRGLRGTRAVT